jgi:hypothetical protein
MFTHIYTLSEVDIYDCSRSVHCGVVVRSDKRSVEARAFLDTF